MSPSCSARSNFNPTPPAPGRGRLRLVGQVERLLRTDVDVGRIHRLTVAEGSVQVDAAIEGPRQLSRGVATGFQRAEHSLPAYQAALSRLQLDEIGLARVRHHHRDCGRALRRLRLELRGGGYGRPRVL